MQNFVVLFKIIAKFYSIRRFFQNNILFILKQIWFFKNKFVYLYKDIEHRSTLMLQDIQKHKTGKCMEVERQHLSVVF